MPLIPSREARTDETSWRIKDGQNSSVASAFQPTDNANIVKAAVNFCLNRACFGRREAMPQIATQRTTLLFDFAHRISPIIWPLRHIFISVSHH